MDIDRMIVGAICLMGLLFIGGLVALSIIEALQGC